MTLISNSIKMRKTLFLILSITLFSIASNAQVKPQYEVKIITSIESIVPNGIGRSRLISTDTKVDYREFTTTQSADKGDRNKSDRKDIRIKDYDETKMLNFFNVGGIRFQNIASNDALLTSKINEMLENGWDLAFINTGVESYGGKDDNSGIYITRYLFKRLKQQEPSDEDKTVSTL